MALIFRKINKNGSIYKIFQKSLATLQPELIKTSTCSNIFTFASLLMITYL